MPGQGLPFYASLDDNAFVRGLRKMEGQADSSAKRIGGAFTSLAGPLAAIGPAVAAAFTGDAIARGIKEVYDFTEGLGDLSDQTGIGVGRLQVLGRVFQNAGLQAEDAGGSINKMQAFLAGGISGEAKTIDTLRDLGLNFLDIKRLAPERQFNAIGDAIAALDSPLKRAAAAREIFGKSGGKLLSVFNDPESKASSVLSERAQLLERNAEIFSTVSIKLGRAGDIFKGFYAGAAEELAKPVDTMLDKLESVNLIKYGQMFGDSLIEGATGVLEMLVALKKANLSDVGTQFGSALKEGLEEGATALFLRLAANEATFANQLIASFEYAGESLNSVFRASPAILQNVTDGLSFGLSAASERFVADMLSGISKAADALGAGFGWVATHGIGDIEIRLETAAKNFGEFMLDALTPTSAKIAKMGAEIFAQAAANMAGGTLGDAMEAALTGRKFNLGDSMNRQADENAQRARQSFNAAATTAGLAAVQPKFAVQDVTGAAALQARASAALSGLPHAFGKLFGQSKPEGGEGSDSATGAQPPAKALADHARMFSSPGMQWGKMIGRPGVSLGPEGFHYDNEDKYSDIPRAAGHFSGQGMRFKNDNNETRNVGLETGHLFTGGLEDNAEQRRKGLQAMRDQVQYQNPLLQGNALNAAVQQEQARQTRDAYVNQYRAAWDAKHPVEAEARKAQEAKNKGATSADMDKVAERFERAIKQLTVN